MVRLKKPTETVLYSFTGGSDGGDPVGGLIADSSGNLYGTTEVGGINGQGCTIGIAFVGTGCGVVFKLSPSGTETVLYSFMGNGDGANPMAGLIADSSGNLYGTTFNGGSAQSNCDNNGPQCGSVFEISGTTETVLYDFNSVISFTVNDGANPTAGLIADSSGNLYGTTQYGGFPGPGCNGLGCGVVFKLSPSGTETVLYAFTGGNDGGNPVAGLIADSSGNLYGTTEFGGASGNGVVFKLSPSGTETVLHSFTGSDGANPTAGLIADSSGISMARQRMAAARHAPPSPGSRPDAAWCSRFPQAGPIPCCTPSPAPAATGLIPKPA